MQVILEHRMHVKKTLYSVKEESVHNREMSSAKGRKQFLYRALLGNKAVL